jgi:catechol 2,3-dioxygenase-like lactoylglutathione lyase family enzyme
MTAVRLDHLGLDVGDVPRTRDWYVSVLGLRVEFESAAPPVAGLTDDGDVTLILAATDGEPSRCNLFFQVDDVAATHRALAERGVEIRNAPQQNAWGYGAELLDPDGRLVGIWDEKTMEQ